MNKTDLRRVYLARRKALSPAERAEKSRRISERFFAGFEVADIKTLHCFLPIEKFAEINTRLILEKIRREFPQIQTLAPRVDFQTNEIESVKFSPETNLTENDWQILEPVGDETVAASEIDLVLVPLICFDERGFRVGYGKGFYDRFLKRCRRDCAKIGLSYFAPVAKIADAKDFDAALDACVTPEKIWRF